MRGPPPPCGFGAAAFPSTLRFEAKAGGGGGNRTHVRKPSIADSTCLSGFTVTSGKHSKLGKETHSTPSQKFLRESLGEIRTSEKSANVTPRPVPRTEQGSRLRILTQLRLTHRWHLSSLPFYLRGSTASTCIYYVNYSRRIQVAPKTSSLPIRCCSLP